MGAEVPGDVEDGADGVEDGEHGGVLLDNEDDGAEDGEDPADGEADDPAEHPRLPRALAALDLVPYFLVGALFAAAEKPLLLVALVAHQY